MHIKSNIKQSSSMFYILKRIPKIPRHYGKRLTLSFPNCKYSLRFQYFQNPSTNFQKLNYFWSTKSQPSRETRQIQVRIKHYFQADHSSFCWQVIQTPFSVSKLTELVLLQSVSQAEKKDLAEILKCVNSKLATICTDTLCYSLCHWLGALLLFANVSN